MPYQAWVCDHCSHIEVGGGKAIEHEKNCVFNPVNKHCHTCKHYEYTMVFHTEECDIKQKGFEDYMDKEAWPYELLAMGDATTRVDETAYSNAKTAWKNRRPGQGLTTRNLPAEILKGGTGGSPLRELSDLMSFMKSNIQDGLMVPSISQLYNSTEASATVMTKHVMTVLGQPIQWILKEQYQNEILKPYMEASGFSVKSAPELTFESPDVHKQEEMDFWVGLVNAKIQTPMQAADHLGLEYDEEYFVEQQEQMMQQLQQGAQTGEDNPEEKPKEEKPVVETRGDVTYEVKVRHD